MRRYAAPDGARIPAALAEYARVRAPQASRVQHTARLWGDIWHVDGVAAVLRDELFMRHAPDDYRYTDWLYRPTGSAEDARPGPAVAGPRAEGAPAEGMAVQ